MSVNNKFTCGFLSKKIITPKKYFQTLNNILRIWKNYYINFELENFIWINKKEKNYKSL